MQNSSAVHGLYTLHIEIYWCSSFDIYYRGTRRPVLAWIYYTLVGLCRFLHSASSSSWLLGLNDCNSYPPPTYPGHSFSSFRASLILMGLTMITILITVLMIMLSSWLWLWKFSSLHHDIFPSSQSSSSSSSSSPLSSSSSSPSSSSSSS